MPPKRQRLKNPNKNRYNTTNRRVPSEPGVPRKGEPAEEVLRRRIDARRNLPTPEEQLPIHRHSEESKPKVSGVRRDLPMITINGMVYTNDSFSVCTKGLALGFTQLKCQVSIDAWPNGSRALPVPDEIRKCVKRSTDNKIGIRISHPDSFTVLDYYKFKIGFGVCETQTIQKKWTTVCNKHCDQVWTPSTFCSDIFKNNGVECDVFTVPNGFDERYFNKGIKKYDFGLPANTFIFLTVGNSQARKGTDELFQAFSREFRPDEPVALVYKTYAGWATGARKYEKKGKIIHIESDVPYTEIGGLYTTSNCFVLPTRGEGFGLPILEAKACNIPVITTNWSGHLDFCDNKDTYLLEYTGFSKAFEKQDWQGYWVDPDVKHLRYLMRYVYENRDMAQKKADAAYEKVHNKWTWKHSARKGLLALSHGVDYFNNYLDFEEYRF